MIIEPENPMNTHDSESVKMKNRKPLKVEAGTAAMARDQATEPKVNEKGTDPKMKDAQNGAWKRDGQI
jgi:hypothetical protein